MAEQDANKNKQLVAREYLRVSKSDGDRYTDHSKSTDEQTAENQVAIARQGWKRHPSPITEPDVSASRFSKVLREKFWNMLAEIESGQFGADILVLWESSRGSRRVGEWEDLIDACAAQRIQIWVTTHNRIYDLRNNRDRKTMLEDAVDSDYESGKTSERLRRAMRANAEAGRVHGKNLYGYRRIKEYDEAKRKEVLVEIIEDPKQAPIVKEAVRRVIAGESYHQIAKSFNEREIPIRRVAYKEHNQMKGWTSVSIKQMIEMPAYRGIRQHTRDGVTELLDVKTMWPALISPEEWAALEARFAHDKQKWPNSRSDEIKHMLTGVARCGVCGSIVRVGKQNEGPREPVFDSDGKPVLYPKGHRYEGKQMKKAAGVYFTYMCQGAPGRTGFHVAMKEEHLDQAITELVLARLERPDFLATAGQKDGDVDAERQAILDEIKGYQEWLEQVRERATRERKLDLLFDQQERTEPLIRDAQRRLEALVKVDPVVVDMVKAGDIRKRWKRLSIAERRHIISAVVTPVINTVPVKPKGEKWEGNNYRGAKGINTERLELIWK